MRRLRDDDAHIERIEEEAMEAIAEQVLDDARDDCPGYRLQDFDVASRLVTIACGVCGRQTVDVSMRFEEEVQQRIEDIPYQEWNV